VNADQETSPRLEDPSPIEGAAAGLESRLLTLVERRRRTGPAARPDVIDALLAGPVTGAQLRDELMTLFITGAENPRNALTWAVYLLSRHPEVARRVRVRRRPPAPPDRRYLDVPRTATGPATTA